MEIDLAGTDIKYKTAQNLSIFAENDSALVKEVADLLQVNLDAVYKYRTSKKHPFPSPIRARDILTLFCDFQGQVMKKHLKDLAKYSTDQAVIDELNRLASAQGKKEFAEQIEDQKQTLFQLIKKYKIKLTLE